jgi:hypothetical protein
VCIREDLALNSPSIVTAHLSVFALITRAAFGNRRKLPLPQHEFGLMI